MTSWADLYQEGDEVIIPEFRTKVDLPCQTGAWVTCPVEGQSGQQIFVPYNLMKRVIPEVLVGDIWRAEDGREWYARYSWNNTGAIVLEDFEGNTELYGSGSLTPAMNFEKFFAEKKPTLVRRRCQG